jgi:hypothetical protein
VDWLAPAAHTVTTTRDDSGCVGGNPTRTPREPLGAVRDSFDEGAFAQPLEQFPVAGQPVARVSFTRAGELQHDRFAAVAPWFSDTQDRCPVAGGAADANDDLIRHRRDA